MRQQRLIAAAALVWVLLVGGGWWLLTDYATRPAPVGAVPDAWPAHAELAPPAGRASLVMLAHPRCPCTRASLHELERIMARAGERLQAHVLFYRPPQEPDAWAHTDLWRLAAAIPGVTPHVDPDGRNAGRFGALASGQVVLYGPDGRLLFHGGITAGRGHEGLNAGRQAILAYVRDGTPDAPQAPVYGCFIRGQVRPDPLGS
ncbi:hypothetical protein AWN76_017535 [Rhodothermaceae bacterium RA]|nr:hypothetical protein AWN76_017535 [Rhodothermaceae bacterium RA]